MITISRNRDFVVKIRQAPGVRAALTNIIWNADDNLISQSLDLMAPHFGKHPIISVDYAGKKLTSKSKKFVDTIQTINFYFSARFLRDIIPETLDGYHRLGQSLKSLPDFVEIPTNSVRASDRPSVSPLFIIPGVEDDPVELVTPIIQNKAMYPAFVAHIPHNGFVSVPNIASALIPVNHFFFFLNP